MMEKDAKIYVAGHRGLVGNVFIRIFDVENSLLRCIIIYILSYLSCLILDRFKCGFIKKLIE